MPRLRLGLAAWVVAAAAGFSDPQPRPAAAVRLGESAPELPQGAVKGKLAVLVFAERATPLPEHVLKKLEECGAVAVLVSRQPPEEGVKGYTVAADPEERLTRRFLKTGSAVILVDGEGVVRAVAPSGADPAALAARWRAGKVLFESACARCHTEDGAPEYYSFNIKKLAGIGNRLTPAEILERTNPVPMGLNHYSIRAFLYTKEEIDALITYVAGL